MQCKYPTDGPGAFLAAAAAVRASARRTVRQATGREDVATAHGAATHQAEANKRAAVAWRACCCCMRFCKQSRSKYCGPPVRLCLCVCVTVCLSVRVGRVRVSLRPDWTGVARMAREVRGPPHSHSSRPRRNRREKLDGAEEVIDETIIYSFVRLLVN